MDKSKKYVKADPMFIEESVWDSLQEAATRDARPVEHIIEVALKQYVQQREL